ncbi:MATN2 [Branchiostoma lanceolatum]|nr:MATN2 [Branchiostoma lanceolatum]
MANVEVPDCIFFLPTPTDILELHGIRDVRSMRWTLLVSVLLLSTSIGGTNAQDPVGLWPLNAEHGASDVTGNGNDGVATGTQLAAGPYGDADGSFLFSGTTNSYVDIPNNGALDVRYSCTILAHIYPTGEAGPIFNYVATNNGWGAHLWQVSAEQLFWRPVSREENFELTPAVRGPLQQNVWNYVAATFDNSTGMAYIWNNGEIIGKRQIRNAEIETQWPIRVARRNGDSRIFTGRLACLQLYNYAMTADQIAAAQEKCRPQPCSVETVFVVDRSSSTQSTGFSNAKQYMVDFAQCFTGQDIGVGAIPYDCVPKTSFQLGIYTVGDALLTDAVYNMQYTGGTTRTALAITYMMNTANFRVGVPRVAVIITDGSPEESISELAAKADMARDAGIILYAVGNGVLVDNAALEAIAGGPDNVFSIAAPCDLATRILELCG